MNPQAEERFLDENETAKLLSVSVHTLRGQRHARRGLPFYKLGRSCRYKLSDILKHMAGLKVKTAERGAR
ncbi:MAG: helix-turn-helix domain-containing protein [Desulfobacterales bacterium]